MGTAPITIAVRPRLDLRRVCCPAILDPSRFAPRVLSSDPGTEARVGTAWLRLDSQLGCQLHARSFRKRLAPQMEARILLGSLRHALSIRPPPETILGKKNRRCLRLPPPPLSSSVVCRWPPLPPSSVVRRWSPPLPWSSAAAPASLRRPTLSTEVEKNVWPAVVAPTGKVKPMIYKTFPSSEAADAHRLMETSTHIGKIL
uniref:Uncharacterized protein n=1 Tax=Setaria viridis TaxID=4556 RepID=A0A4U6V7S2_SETVI|nr:hypothetical protein SEVIR_4G265601v2 [Setaria viridis]